MTNITYDPANYRMEISGHAGFAPAGQDIVCAATSILMMTLVNMVDDHAESMRPQIYKRDGEIKISCEPTKGNTTKCTTIYDTIFGGFELLSLNYPDYVQTVKVKGE